MDPKRYNQILDQSIRRIESGEELEICHKDLKKLSKVNSRDFNVLSLLGGLEILRGRYHQAKLYLRRGLEIEPSAYNILSNLGLVYYHLGQYSRSLEMYNRSISINPMSESHINRGVLYQELNQDKSAISDFDQAQKYSSSSKVQWNKSISLLKLGYYNLGFELYSKYYHQLPQSLLPKSLVKVDRSKLWKGEELGSKVLVVYQEQGYGDVIQMIRYIPLIKGHVKIQVLPELCRLLRSQYSEVYSTEEVVEYDYIIPFELLPYVFKTEVGSIPSSKGNYIAINGTSNREIKVVGISWSSINGEKYKQRRVIELSKLLEVLEGYKVVNLQKYVNSHDIKELSRKGVEYGFAIEDDFFNLSQKISKCDLVISIDSVVVHLSGAMQGVRSWVLLPYNVDWRWNAPWYSNVYQIRQDRSCSWDPVLSEVRQKLRENRECQ